MKQNNAKKSGGNDFKAKNAHKSFAKKKEIINPFDKFSNAKKKHEVLNRRVKGEDRNVGRAREKAIDERKNKLLKDYHNSKKSSTFLDKRFGESDANLSLEEKMFMRFQQERVKKVRNGSLFNLDANDTEVLTHKGQQLGSSNMDDRDWVSSDEEGGGKLDKEVVNKLHFGGGMVETKRSSEGIYGPSNDEEEYGGPRKGRLEALQEIVMKSKLHKMQRKEAKEEQEDEREKLDKAFEDLFATSQIDITRPEKGRRSRDRDDLGDLDDMDAYDVSLREMAFEAKVQPSDRTKTEEEIAVETREKIEELEKARLKRMRQVALPEDKEADGALRPGSGGRRVKHITDDMIDEPVSRKPAKAAAPVSDDEGEDGDSEEGGEDEEYSEEGDSDEEEDEEEGEGDDDEDEEEEDEEVSDEEMDYDAQPDEEKEGSEDGSDEEDSEDDEASKRGNRNRRGGKAVAKKQMYVDDGINLSMPHKITCPVDLESFDELVAQHVRSDVDMNALISRILAWNSVHLPGAQGAENKNLMHNFLDVLLKHFVRVGDSLGSDKNDEDSVLSQLDFLCGTIFTLSEQVGDSCAALWGRTLKILQSQLQKRLRDYSQGNRESCWPSLGRLLLLQLLGHVFSVTDLKNEIVGPAALFLCQCIAQCPVSNAKELSSGLLACNILLTYTAETKRFVPEILTFAHSTMAAFLPELITDRKQFQSTFNSSSLAWLRLSASQGQASSSGDHRISWVSFGSSSSSKSPTTASSLLHSTYMLIGAVLSQYEHSSAVSELFDPILSTLRALNPQSAPVLSNYLQKQHADLLEKILSVCLNRSTERVPLQWRKAVTVSIDMKTPRFQLDYTFKKDTDPDEDRVKLKQLNRQFKREKKAAMRELRRDSDYIDQERFKEVTAAHEKRREERVRNYGWMEEQQATVNMQVRQGKGLMKGGGSNVAKKARVKRM